jgi:hypothetical protein
MIAIRALSLGAVLLAGVAASALAAPGETTTATSPQMSSPALSHDGNSQLGPANETGTAGRPPTAALPDKMAGPVPPKGTGTGPVPPKGSNSADTDGTKSVGCGGTC